MRAPELASADGQCRVREEAAFPFSINLPNVSTSVAGGVQHVAAITSGRLLFDTDGAAYGCAFALLRKFTLLSFRWVFAAQIGCEQAGSMRTAKANAPLSI